MSWNMRIGYDNDFPHVIGLDYFRHGHSADPVKALDQGDKLRKCIAKLEEEVRSVVRGKELEPQLLADKELLKKVEDFNLQLEMTKRTNAAVVREMGPVIQEAVTTSVKAAMQEYTQAANKLTGQLVERRVAEGMQALTSRTEAIVTKSVEAALQTFTARQEELQGIREIEQQAENMELK